MDNPIVTELLFQYSRLKALYQAGKLNRDQFIVEVQKLQAQDAQGFYWAVDAGTGNLLRYEGERWVPYKVTAKSSSSIDQKLISNPGCRKALGVVTLVMPIVTAFIWFAYSSLSPSSEGWDCLTPMILAGLPITLILVQKPLDSILMPIHRIKKAFPKIFLRGAALAIPIVLSIACSQTAGSEYGGLRWATIITILGGYLLLHEPEELK